MRVGCGLLLCVIAQSLATEEGLVAAAVESLAEGSLQQVLDRPEPKRSIEVARPTVTHKPELGEADSPPPDWLMGQTADLNFGMFFETTNRLFVNPDGAVWGAAEKGYFAKGDTGSAAPPGKLVDGTYVTSGNWQVGETTSGHWGIFKDQEPKLIVTDQGEVWGQFEGGFFEAKDPETETEQKKEALPSHFGLQDGTSIVSGSWMVGQTLSGHLGWYKHKELKALLHQDGDMWGAFASGWFRVSEESERASGELSHPMSTTVVDCQVGAWSAYVECDKKCDGGMQARQRTVEAPSQNGGGSCPYLTQSRTCNTFGCATDCALSEWGAWDDCSQACGGGDQTRVRTVITYPSSRGLPCPGLEQTRQCNLQKCGAKMCLTLSAAFNKLADRDDDVYFVAKQQSMAAEDNYAAMTPQQKWLRWNLGSHQIEEGPFDFSEGTDFSSLPEALKANGVDGALNLQSDSEQVFLFSSTTTDSGHEKEWTGKFQVWNVGSSSPDGTLTEIKAPNKMFSNLPEPFNTRIDATLNINPQNATSYLFHNLRDSQANPDRVVVQTFDASVTPGRVVGQQFNMSHWPRMPEPFLTQIDAAVNRGRFGYEAYLFSGSHWLLWDLMKEEVVDGPFDMAEHHTFKPLLDGLELCSGYDLKAIGKDSMLHRALLSTVPHPIGVVSKIVGASGGKGYADNVLEQNAPDSADHSIADLAAAIPEVRFNNPTHLAIEGSGTPDAVAYVTDTNNHAIRRIHLASGNTTTVAGGGQGAGFMDGTGAEAKFRFPSGVTVVRRHGNDSPGDVLYVADTGNDAIRRVFIRDGADTGSVLTVAGGGGKQCKTCATFDDMLCTGCCQCTQGGFVDGHGIEAMFNKPSDVSLLYNRTAVGITANEFIYVADRDNHAIRRIIVKPGVTAGDKAGQVTTIAGGAKQDSSPTSGYTDGFGSDAQFNHPSSISALRVTPEEVQVPSYDTLYVADTQNKALRRVVLPLVPTGRLESHVLTTGDVSIIEHDQREREQAKRLAVQKAHLDAINAAHKNTEAQIAVEEAAVADEAALQPSSRRLLQTVEDLGEQNDVASALPARYADNGGTSPKDTPCQLPFTYGGRAYNDCSNVLVPELGINASSVGANGWCLTEDDGEEQLWAPCREPGYEPSRCIMSEWSVFEECPVTCGAGGVTKRVRTIVQQGDYGCDVLEESRSCNAFACGAVVTVTGGLDAEGAARGYGVAAKQGGERDLEFAPVSVTAMHTKGVDVVYTVGQEDSASAAAIHRADIEPHAVTMTIPGHYLGANSVALQSAEGPASALFATTLEHNIGKIDLSLVIDCEDWMSNALNHWDSDPHKTGKVMRSDALTVNLKAGGALQTEWSFVGYKRIKEVGFQDFKTLENPQPWKGDLVKNMMCIRQTQVPEENVYTSEECCTAKYGPVLDKPCGGKYVECSQLHNKVLRQWASAKRDLEDELSQF